MLLPAPARFSTGAIRTRLWIALALLAVLCLTMAVIEVQQTTALRARLAIAADQRVAAARRSDRALEHYRQQMQVYQDAVQLGETTLLANAREDAEAVQEDLRRLLASALPAAQEREAAQVLQEHEAFTAQATEVYPRLARAQAAVDPSTAQALYRRSLELKDRLAKLSAACAQELQDALRTIQSSVERQRALDTSIFAATSLVVIILVAHLIHGLSSRLGLLVQASDRMASGDFEAPIALVGRDELAALAHSFRTMRDAVASRDTRLRELNASLEAQVVARTQELSARNVDLEHEIHEREQIQESLRLVESAVNQSPDCILIAALVDGSEWPLIVTANPAITDRFGYRRDRLLGQALSLLIVRSEAAKLLEWIRAARSGGSAHGESLVACTDGRVVAVEWRLAAVRDGRGETTHVIAIVQDITARRQAEQELERTQANLLEASRQAGQAEVATGVLHNVGNVLNSINVSTSVVTERLRALRLDALHRAVGALQAEGQRPSEGADATKHEQLRAYLALIDDHLRKERAGILDELQRLTHNVDHIKDIISMQQTYARVSGVTQRVAPAELMEDALRMHAAALERLQVEVIREFQPLPALLLDRHRILQILINLVSNALHALAASPQGTHRLTLRILERQQRVVLEVADTGVGIAPEHLTRIFSHGFTTREGGHGFGLHASVNAAREMKGDLTVASAGVGKGATFTLEVPT